jgi:YD repeat-containing protein
MRYNDKNQLVTQIYPDSTPDNLDDNPTVITTYDEAGNQKSVINADGQTTFYEYDPLNRPTQMILPDSTLGDLTDNQKLDFVYDQAGRITTQVN